MLIPIHKFTFGVRVIKPLRPLNKAAWDIADNPGYRPTPLGRGKELSTPVTCVFACNIVFICSFIMYDLVCNLALVFSDIAHDLVVLYLTRKTQIPET